MTGRRAIVRGQLHRIDCAVRANESSPAGMFLDALKAGKWDRTDDDLPADEQISDYHWFLNAIRHWANTGEPAYRDAVKHLDDGVWEFRHADKRLTFYDTDGKSGYSAKLPIYDHAQAEAPESPHWHIPFFDPLIRLGHAFTKVSQKTPKKDLIEMKAVREEDLTHDR
ncbi:MAG: hypothetical protein K0U78_10510 [Actinomycetia bacterium]|nr:hypothetical protein [Actinomycetes bacterium]